MDHVGLVPYTLIISCPYPMKKPLPKGHAPDPHHGPLLYITPFSIVSPSLTLHFLFLISLPHPPKKDMPPPGPKSMDESFEYFSSSTNLEPMLIVL